jgi:hypothetical protein
MSRPTPELEELVDLFCEGEMSVEQAGRLEALVKESAEAGDYLRDTFEIHCELAWEFGRAEVQTSPPSTPIRQGVEKVSSEVLASPVVLRDAGNRRPILGLAFSAVAALFVVAITLWLTVFHGLGTRQYIAHVSKLRWCDENVPGAESLLQAGTVLSVHRGLLEVSYQSGVRMTIQGPAEVELDSPSVVDLRGGSVTADVPAVARGFTVHTPNCTVVDLGTRFGVASDGGRTDIAVFAGNVVLRPTGSSPEGPQEQQLAANKAVRVIGVPGKETVKTESIAASSLHFVQSITESASMFQALVESNAHLIHCYPLEGATNEERLLDRRGELNLREVSMRDGDGGGRLEFRPFALDPSMEVVAPFRAAQFGAAHGRGLQSRGVFQPPQNMTVELLMSLSGVGNGQEGFVATAVSTRHDRDQCGFLLAAVGNGELACLLDGGSEWLRSGFKLVPGRWYYVAATFCAKNAGTEINGYAMELGDKNARLNWIVRNQMVPGVPASGMLGIGKGFDGEMASAYPWAGELGHIAIYDVALDRDALETHFQAIASQVRIGSAPAKSN